MNTPTMKTIKPTPWATITTEVTELFSYKSLARMRASLSYSFAVMGVLAPLLFSCATVNSSRDIDGLNVQSGDTETVQNSEILVQAQDCVLCDSKPSEARDLKEDDNDPTRSLREKAFETSEPQIVNKDEDVNDLSFLDIAPDKVEDSLDPTRVVPKEHLDAAKDDGEIPTAEVDQDSSGPTANVDENGIPTANLDTEDFGTFDLNAEDASKIVLANMKPEQELGDDSSFEESSLTDDLKEESYTDQMLASIVDDGSASDNQAPTAPFYDPFAGGSLLAQLDVDSDSMLPVTESGDTSTDPVASETLIAYLDQGSEESTFIEIPRVLIEEASPVRIATRKVPAPSVIAATHLAVHKAPSRVRVAKATIKKGPTFDSAALSHSALLVMNRLATVHFSDLVFKDSDQGMAGTETSKRFAGSHSAAIILANTEKANRRLRKRALAARTKEIFFTSQV
jgi:hypothetical protein